MNLRMMGLAALVASVVVVGCGESATDAGTDAVTLKITNRLLLPITVNANGKEVMTVGASSVKEVDLGKLDTLKVDWDLVRATMGGTEIGDYVGGIFKTKIDPSGTISISIDNVVSGYKVFMPFVTNNTADPLEMVVNFGLEDENRCDCSIVPGNMETSLGYYWLYGATQIRAYKSGSNYSGEHAAWDYGGEFNSGDIDYATGRLSLVADELGSNIATDDPTDRASTAMPTNGGPSSVTADEESMK
jgi:hypothetical protein